MQIRGCKILSVIPIMMMVMLGGSIAFAEQIIEFKDGTVIKGEIQNTTLTVKTKFGELNAEIDNIDFISEGTVELHGGSKVMGDLLVGDGGLTVKTKYGTWTLTFEPEDLQMITFQK